MEINIQAPIIPGVGLGGLNLLTPIADLVNLVARERESGAITDREFHTGERSYGLRNGAIWVEFRQNDQRILELTADRGYGGALFDAIRIGTTIREAMALDPRIYLNDLECFFMIEGVDGVLLSIDDDDPSLDFALDMPISQITVHEPGRYYRTR